MASASFGLCSTVSDTACSTRWRTLRAVAALGACTVLAGCEHEVMPLVAPDASTSSGVCIGVKPPTSAWTADPSNGGGAGPDAADAGPPTGEPAPKWALTDFQPQSCGFEATYGLDVFRGKVTLIAVLEGF